MSTERDPFLQTLAYLLHGDSEASLEKAPAELSQSEWDEFLESFSLSPDDRRDAIQKMWNRQEN